MDHPSRTPIAQPWRLSDRGRQWFDVVLVVLLLLPLPLFAIAHRPVPDTVLGLVQIVAVLVRRRHAVEAFAVVAAASGLQAVLIDTPIWGQVAFPIALYSVARYARGRWGLAALGVGIAGAAVASYDWVHNWLADDVNDPSTGAYLSYFVTIAVIVVAAWALGTLGRTRAAYVGALLDRNDQLHRESAQQVALAAAEERTRIAREMHDVVAHGLSVIVVQADGARYAAEQDPAIAAKTLGTISEAAREALTEMRRTLGLLRADDAAQTRPQPRLADLPALVEETRAAGTRVRATLPGPDTVVPDGVGLTTFRVVQEALSNVRKHAGPSAVATVRVEAGADVTVEVRDDGRGAAAADDGGGLGLVGMRERVAAHGGTLETGPVTGGGFRVLARIPL
ncbi:Signal transduction histidine kinase [Nocardioides terrae]|uniref:histidine kinase n=1 Tax=Nocardioides terrae TaxID=574651 RepID=A0A1I1GXS7_9ACTN|nr:histidine kinase [Nocardioides terrae]SFC16341.1 Signal transduction histidine kinase [Nocardioides terrae]